MEGQNPFEYVAPTPESVRRIEAVRQDLRMALITLQVQVPASRERSLAITKLEEVSMWANKGIVFNQG